jgi:hypothetical protein
MSKGSISKKEKSDARKRHKENEKEEEDLLSCEVQSIMFENRKTREVIILDCSSCSYSQSVSQSVS